MRDLTIGFAITGSFCTFKAVFPQMNLLVEHGYRVLPIMSENAYATDTRFGRAADWAAQAEEICGEKVIHTIAQAEPIGPKKLLDLLILAPCTGNTLGKLACGIYDTAPTLAVKSHRRNGRPVLIAVSTNDALAGAAAARLCAGLAKGLRAALWLPIAAGMMRIAAGRAEKPLRAAGLLLAAAGLLGGTVQALSGAAGSRTIGLWLGAAAAPLLSAATVRLRRMRQGATHVRVRMTCGGRTAAFTAMVDSGNCLRDYLTHRPVIVMPQARGYRLFGLENTPLRPIFADTAGGRQMMLCLTPEATILDNGQTKRAVEALLALSPGLGGNAPALLPVSLLEDGQEGV